MNKNLLIVFVKNPVLGRVKTRLAKAIGNEKALQVYQRLVEITEKAIQNVKAEKHVYFSEVIMGEKWQKTAKFIQKGTNLGEKMQNAIGKGFNDGFNKIILIGSDLPDISTKVIEQGFDELSKNEVVFGSAADGGYYLVGMSKAHFCIFKNKPWSTANLLKNTLLELKGKNVNYSLLATLNDIDTLEDLKNSSVYASLKQYT